MRRYWIGIALGVLAVFVSGLVIMRAGREGARLVERTLESADPISIPLAFVPFRLDGREVGSIREIQFQRSSPDVVRGVDLDVTIKDAQIVDRLRTCTLTASHIDNFDRNTTFECVDQKAAETGKYVAFGSVKIEKTDIARVLLVPTEELAKWQHDDHAQSTHADAQHRLAKAIARLEADSGGVVIDVWDALKQAGIQFKADSTGALLHIADQTSGAKLFLRADSTGVIIDAHDPSDSSKLQLRADSSGLRINVQEGATTKTRSITNH